MQPAHELVINAACVTSLSPAGFANARTKIGFGSETFWPYQSPSAGDALALQGSKEKNACAKSLEKTDS